MSRHPRSDTYDEAWQLSTVMGPNVLWLTEALCEKVTLQAGQRVLDLGCGKAASSIFLAREFGVTVWAADIWISPTDNAARIDASGLNDRVFPVYGEAHRLPFAHEYFDAIVSLDAFHYFGTDDTYLPQLTPFLRLGGTLGIVVPGVREELDVTPEYFLDGLNSFHSPAWWQRHWIRSGGVTDVEADWVPDGWADWLAWHERCQETGSSPLPHMADAELAMLRADKGRLLGFTRVVARRA
ncbi:MAG: methyltransferase domain-containing protein [Acidimicrobiia bacterium]